MRRKIIKVNDYKLNDSTKLYNQLYKVIPRILKQDHFKTIQFGTVEDDFSRGKITLLIKF